MLKRSLLTCAVAAAFPIVAQADPILPAPDTTPADPNLPPTTTPTPIETPSADPIDTTPTALDPTPTTTTTTTTTAAPYAELPTLDEVDVSPTSYAWYDNRLSSGIGVAVVIGGGVSGFTDRQMRDTVSSNVSGLWDARFSFGTHVPIGLDLSYVGTAVDLNTLSGTGNATLIGTTTEAALRWNVLPHSDFTPYVFGGIGWQRYDVTGSTVNLSDSGMRQSDNSIEFPMGLGLNYRTPGGFVIDARGTYRANIDQGLVLESGGNPTSNNSDNFVPMNTWEASAAVGYEF